MDERFLLPRAKDERLAPPFIGGVLEDAFKKVAGGIGVLL
jgi:hypothetical protein